ncbi:MAG TPA: glycosyltransferase [Candidatus Hydrogenedentes bacterium]|nr:glycosyltransferase [Candidatus Hydrogenedentota bacterium]HPG66788.1 glycosyltransferase [Candidatus Hydrogenedentota bacterium]
MKILHVYKDFDPPVHGGMERHMALMCRFQRQWAHVEALTCSRSLGTRVTERDGTRVTEVGEFGRFQSAPVSPLFPWYMRQVKADVVVVHAPNPTAEIGWLMARPSGRLIVRYQSDVVRQATAMKVYAPLQMTFLRKAAMILPSSQQYLDTSPSLQRVRDRCRVIPLGILPKEFALRDPARVEALRAAYGGGFVLFSGRHRYYKGLEFLVRAAPRIEAPVVVAGAGPERARCMALARALNVRIEFPGPLDQEDLVAHLHACDVFVFPSVARSEAFGLSMLEAQACGKPVVATTLGTGVELVNLHGQTGLNVPPRDPEALADAVNALLEDEARRDAMGRFARARVEGEFHAERIARAEFDAYQEVLG